MVVKTKSLENDLQWEPLPTDTPEMHWVTNSYQSHNLKVTIILRVLILAQIR
jgi:hypothetical protein